MARFSGRRTGRLMWLALAACILTACPALAEEGVLLKYHHSPGDRAVYACGVSSRAQITEEGGASARAEMVVQMTCLVEVLGDTASGDWGMVGSFPDGVLTVKVEGKEESHPFGDVGLRYVVSPRGEIKSVRLLGGEPPVLLFGGGVLALTPDGAFLLSGAGVFPDQPLGKGDTWKGVAGLPHLRGGGTYQIAYESALLGEEEFHGAKCWKIKTQTRQELQDTVTSCDGAGQVDFSVKSSGEETWLFDPSRGVIVSVAGTHNVKVGATIEHSGQKLVRTTTTGVLNTRSILREFNGVKIAPE